MLFGKLLECARQALELLGFIRARSGNAVVLGRQSLEQLGVFRLSGQSAALDDGIVGDFHGRVGVKKPARGGLCAVTLLRGAVVP